MRKNKTTTHISGVNPDAIPMNSTQYEAFKQILGGCALLGTGIEYLEPHLKKLKLAGMAKGARGILNKVTDTVIDHMPTEKLNKFIHEFKFLSARVTYKAIGKDTDIDYDVYNCSAVETVCSELLNNTCMLCDKCASEAHKCPLRSAFKSLLPTDVPTPNSGLCEFNGVDLKQYCMERENHNGSRT